jgi:hypothetical protein
MGGCNPCDVNGGGGGGSSLVPAGGASGLADVGAPAQVTISYEPAQVSASVPALEFPETRTGEISGAIRVKLANTTRDTDVLFDALALDSDDFILAGSTCPRALAPGEACAATIRFAPSTTQRRSATLKVRSNAAPLDIALHGEGTARPAPSAGPRGDTGATGATGPAGATGASGPAATSGANGVSVLGASERNHVVRVKCSRKRCRVTGAPHGRAKLLRKSRVYAAGKLPGKLKTRRAVRPGRYTLKVGHERYRAIVR